MAGTGDQLLAGRESYANSAWKDAYASLSSAEQATELASEDLELLAISAYMLGREDEWMQLLERACRRHSEAGAVLLRVANGPGGAAGPPRSEQGPGHGLTGMRERVALLGGSLSAGPAPDGGFVVSAVLPLGEMQ